MYTYIYIYYISYIIIYVCVCNYVCTYLCMYIFMYIHIQQIPSKMLFQNCCQKHCYPMLPLSFPLPIALSRNFAFCLPSETGKGRYPKPFGSLKHGPPLRFRKIQRKSGGFRIQVAKSKNLWPQSTAISNVFL